MLGSVNRMLDNIAFLGLWRSLPVWAMMSGSVAMLILLAVGGLWAERALPLLVMAIPVFIAAHSYAKRWLYLSLLGGTVLTAVLVWGVLTKPADLSATLVVGLLGLFLSEMANRLGRYRNLLEEERTHRLGQLTLLARLRGALTSVQYPHEAYAAGVNHIAYALADVPVCLYVKRGGTFVREHQVNAAHIAPKHSVHTGLIGEAARLRAPMRASAELSDPEFDLVAPVLVEGNVVAVLALGKQALHDRRDGDDADLAMIGLVASELGLVVERVRRAVPGRDDEDVPSWQDELQSSLDALSGSVMALADRCTGTPYSEATQALHTRVNHVRDALQRAALVADPR